MSPPSPRTSPTTSSPGATTWSPSTFLTPSTSSPDFALLILNQPIFSPLRFLRIFRNASLRVCADGAANHLYSLTSTSSTSRPEDYLPDVIIGDLDSISTDVRNFYESHNVRIIRDGSQESTDFGKSLGWIDSKRPEGVTVLAVGALGGRVDQSFHSVHALYYDKLQQTELKPRPEGAPAPGEMKKVIQGSRQILLLSAMNLTMLMERGRNEILLPKRWFGKTCGILPVGGPAVVTTRGLEWDLKEQETRFGGLVSTSNHLVEEVVVVETDVEVVFTVEVREEESEEE